MSLNESAPSDRPIPHSEQPPHFVEYDAPAGGWGAVQAVAKSLHEQNIALKGSKALLAMNQPTGFDCPGCAWPDPQHTSTFEFCENGAKALAAELTRKRVTRELFANRTVTELELESDHWLEEQGRLTEPMRYDRNTDRYVPVSWQDAFDMIGRELRALQSPHEAEFYTSGRTSNEAAFLFQLFGRRFGTNNFPDCSNMCHEATSAALPFSIGVGKGTVVLDDFALCDAIFVIGQNPGTNSPRMMTELRDASRRGVPIVAINPLRERALERFAAPQSPVEMATRTSTTIASEYCQLHIGGDIALLKGIMKSVLAAHDEAENNGKPAVLDMDFIREHTQGFAAFAEDLRKLSWDDVLRISGVSREQIDRMAEIYRNAKNVIIAYGMGITQHVHGSQNVQQIANLLLMRGNIGRPGAGMCPVRGHSNVQGDRTMGVDEKPPAAFLDKLRDVFGFEPPREHGHAVVETMKAMIEGTAKVFIAMGGNFVAAVPDRPIIEAAMRRLKLTVSITTKLNRGALVHGEDALLLPPLARSDRDVQSTGVQSVTVEDSMSMIHASIGLAEPPSPDLKSEVAIVCGIARAALPDNDINWTAFENDYSVIRDRIEAVLPVLFHDFNRRIQLPGGFHLPNPARRRQWNTPSGHAQFIVCESLFENDQPVSAGVLRLTTIRSHDQFNTTVYSLNDRYRGVVGGRRVIFMNQTDMNARGIDSGALVELKAIASDGHARMLRDFTAHPFGIPPGCIAGYFPETNALLALAHYDPLSKTPAAKSIPVLVTPQGSPA